MRAGRVAWAVASIYIVAMTAYGLTASYRRVTMERLMFVALLLTVAAYWIDDFTRRRSRKR